MQSVMRNQPSAGTSHGTLPEQIEILETSDLTLMNNKVQVLSEMFPSKDRKEIYSIFQEHNMDVKLSINVILHASGTPQKIVKLLSWAIIWPQCLN